MKKVNTNKDVLGGAHNDPVNDVYFDMEETAKSYRGTTEYFDVDGIPVKFVYNKNGTSFTCYSFLDGEWAVDRVPTNFELDGILINRKRFKALVKKLGIEEV